MRLFFLAPFVFGALVLGSACGSTASYSAPGAPDARRQCFTPGRIANFAASDNRTLYVRAMDRQVFELATTGACLDLDTADQVAITSFTGSAQLCTGDTANILATDVAGLTGRPQTCRARVTCVLSADEVAALPSRARP